MLNIELHLVQLIKGHPVSQLFQPGQLRYSSSCDIMVKSAVFDIRLIADTHGRKHGPLLPRYLQKRLHSVPEPLLSAGENNLFRPDFQGISLARRIVLTQDHVPGSALSSGQSRPVTNHAFQSLQKKPCLPCQKRSAGLFQHKKAPIAYCKLSLSSFSLFRLRY